MLVVWDSDVTLSCRPPTDLYCTLEVDSFGYFVNKAKTRVYRDTTEPNWNEVRCCSQQALDANVALGESISPQGLPDGFPFRQSHQHSGNLLGEGVTPSKRFLSLYS